MSRGESFNVQWAAGWRLLAFTLASTSLACLLADFYKLCSMRIFALVVFLPATVALLTLCVLDMAGGQRHFCKAIGIGAGAGFLAAVAYDVFRLPFVFASQWGIDSVVPPLNLFKVFAAFGAMLASEPLIQSRYSTAVVLLGWAYHFSNGVTIGVMYLALIGDARRRHWTWAVALAVGLELGMLLTPYPRVFGIPVSSSFVAVTMGAHAVFGVCLGLFARTIASRTPAAG